MGTTASKSTVERFVRGLALTRHGREALEAADAAEARMEERRAARVALEAVAADEARLPALADKVREAEARYLETTERLARERHAAQAAYSAVADSASRRRNTAEGTLRFTADEMIHECGPVVGAILHAIERVRPHLGGAEADRWRALLATEKKMPVRDSEQEAFAAARSRVAKADRAGEILPALEDALDAVRALQLVPEVDPGAVREILETCPRLGPNDEPLNIIEALADVPAPTIR
ncbi:MAG TPA: hypothetical protein VLH75_09325 [Longimicrobiales bacterium]|nr:hypothetical protein [Longimicrobiales bacterium]